MRTRHGIRLCFMDFHMASYPLYWKQDQTHYRIHLTCGDGKFNATQNARYAIHYKTYNCSYSKCVSHCSGSRTLYLETWFSFEKNLTRNNSPLRSDSKLNADIDEWRAEDIPPSTIPPNILSTSSQPDIVIVHSLFKQIHLLELSTL